jgi:hypothetical protein
MPNSPNNPNQHQSDQDDNSGDDQLKFEITMLSAALTSFAGNTVAACR